jgi:putative ABC transport system ATP-binding protein
MKSIITTNDVVKKYKSGTGEIYALRGVSMDIAEGQFVSITGRSGSGKSTLLYQLGLLDHPTSGTIEIEGINTESLSDAERTQFRLSRLGYIFQDYAILPSLTALENVVLPLLMAGYSPARARKKAQEALDKVDLEDRMSNLPSQLSGGQQQRVAIARAIAHDPKIIFADEPTANLDSDTSKVVLDAFIELNREGQTIVMVTHEDEYAKLADRVIELSDGTMIGDTLIQ